MTVWFEMLFGFVKHNFLGKSLVAGILIIQFSIFQYFTSLQEATKTLLVIMEALTYRKQSKFLSIGFWLNSF